MALDFDDAHLREQLSLFEAVIDRDAVAKWLADRLAERAVQLMEESDDFGNDEVRRDVLPVQQHTTRRRDQH